MHLLRMYMKNKNKNKMLTYHPVGMMTPARVI